MATSSQIKRLYARLSKVGFSRAFIREHVIPAEFRVDDNRIDYDQFLSFLSRHLNITAESLADPNSSLVFDSTRTRFFRGPDLTEEIDVGLRIAEGLARVALTGMASRKVGTVPSAQAVRRSILSMGEAWVGFRNLMQYCWDSGIPVLHATNLPPKARKLGGVAAEIDGYPAIILCQQYRYLARHLPRLAHELGHLSGQHLSFIGFHSSTEAEMHFNDRTEGEAHRYAFDLLTGGQSIPADEFRYRSIDALVEATYVRSNTYKIDPGYLIVNRARFTQDWREANIALGIIEGHVNAVELINSEAQKHIQWNKVSAASRYFFQSITRTDEPLQGSTSDGEHDQLISKPTTLSPTLALFEAWAKEDATNDPDELKIRQKEGDDLEVVLRQSRLSLRRVEVANGEVK